MKLFSYLLRNFCVNYKSYVIWLVKALYNVLRREINKSIWYTLISYEAGTHCLHQLALCVINLHMKLYLLFVFYGPIYE